MTSVQKLLTSLAVGALVIVPGTAPAWAQQNSGVRVGVSGDPAQFVFGGHFETKPLMPDVTFRPNAELGVGDGVTLVALNLEFVYSIPIENRPWRVYLGGGPAANFYNHRRGGGSNVGGGFNFVVGAQHDGGMFFEFKAGAIDSPSAKFLIGYAFR
jgi:hypothetical protein